MNIAEVARLAGTSKATVSHVLTGNVNVSPKTKAKVLEIIDRYGYIPNRHAQALAGSPTHMIGVVLNELSNFFFTEIAEGITFTLENKGYVAVMCFTGWNQQKEDSAIQMLLQNHVDGMVISPTSPDSPVFQVLARNNTPFVAINCVPSDLTVPSVTGDNYRGGALVAEHIEACDYDQVIVVTGFDDQSMKDRFIGFSDTYKKPFRTLRYQDLPTRFEGSSLINQIEEMRKRETGTMVVFSTNDTVAIRLEQALKGRLLIPKDIELIGYDDIQPAAYCQVPLTTVSQNAKQMGAEAARLMVARLENKKVDEIHIQMEPRLVVRESAR